MEITILERKDWWDYIHSDLKELIKESLLLSDRAEKWTEKFHDYAFIVFPIAKAYEGYLKTLFFELGFINSEDYTGRRFRIGKALNPALEKEIRERESVYDKIVLYNKGEKIVADRLWETWKECRNYIFHWFPNDLKAISLIEAKEKIAMVLDAISLSYASLKKNL